MTLPQDLLPDAAMTASDDSPKRASSGTAPARFRRPEWGWTHGLLRWPLFLVACLVVAVVLILYFSTRALIHGLEWLFAPSAMRRARLAMERAGNYEAYQAAAAALDEANDVNAWKGRPFSRLYASQMLQAALVELREARLARDWPRLLRALQQSLREVNFGGHLVEALYSRSFTGTKCLVEDYCDALVGGLVALREEALAREAAANFGAEIERGRLSLQDAQRFSEFAACTYGRCSLCLSGGGAMAFQHFGVLEELLRKGMLPKIISGTSGGAAVASYVCCRTDDELLGRARRLDLEIAGKRYPLRLDPDEIQPTCTMWAGSWLEKWRHYLRHGCLFERGPVERLAEAWALGDTTFLEAYQRTGRVLNITCTVMTGGGGKQQVPLLLNYQTHPHVLVSSAVICSGSMPSLLNPSKLLEKCPNTGVIRGHCKQETCYADGSIDMDIPSIVLAQAFGVRYTIAVQVNPHVIPFNFAPHGEAGRPISWIGSKGRWRGGFVLCALELVLKESFRSAWKVMGLLELLPQYCGTKWNMFFSQVYEGSVTLSNDRGYLWKAMNALTDPSKEQFRYWWRQGQVMTWEKIPLLEKRIHVEEALFRLVDALDAMPPAQAPASERVDSSMPEKSSAMPALSRRPSLVLERTAKRSRTASSASS